MRLDSKKYLLWGAILSSFMLTAEPPIDPRVMEEVLSFVKSSEGIIEEARMIDSKEPSVKEDMLFAKTESCDSKSCSFSTEEPSGLIAFMSETVSESAWREHSQVLEKSGGRFVMRGLPGNSFVKFIRLVKNYRERGIIAPIEMDPDLFKKYEVQSVPAIVLDDGKHFDKVSGNISLKSALDMFAKSGQTSERARILLFQLQQFQAREVINGH